MELYRKYRPKKLNQIVGQPEAIKTVETWLRDDRMPHAILLAGPSGCGKTTIARILAKCLGCSDMDFCEINAADVRGIEMARDIRSRMGMSPCGGSCRVWLIDESHRITSDAQSAMLKILEEPPPHAYFMLATTHENKLLPTIRTRCSMIALKLLSIKSLAGLVQEVCDAEGVGVGELVIDRIVEYAQGSARKALVLLDQVIGLGDEDDQLSAIQNVGAEQTAVDLARALFNPRTKWSAIAAMLKGLDDEPEQIRRLVLAWCMNVLLSGGKNSPRAALIMDLFREPFFDTGKPGLVMACYDIFQNKE